MRSILSRLFVPKYDGAASSPHRDCSYGRLLDPDDLPVLMGTLVSSLGLLMPAAAEAVADELGLDLGDLDQVCANKGDHLSAASHSEGDLAGVGSVVHLLVQMLSVHY